MRTGRFRCVRQRDAMQCGVAALWMVLRHYGQDIPLERLESLCVPTAEGVSMKGIADAARALGMECAAVRTTAARLSRLPLPAILHWDQNHFTVLYRVSHAGTRFHVADPACGKRAYDEAEFRRHWEQTEASSGVRKGIVMLFDPESPPDRERVVKLCGKEKEKAWPGYIRFLFDYILRYRRYFLQIALGLVLASVLQLLMPFLTQAIVDIGIRHEDLGFIWLVLLGELMIVAGRTVSDFVRRWLILHISMRVNISLVSDFLIRLLRLPMPFFEVKQAGDLLQRMADHGRIQSFLTGEVLGMTFSVVTLVVFGTVLWIYDTVIFGVFIIGIVLYAVWTACFLRRRKVLDYEAFACQAENSNRTYHLITSMQEIKLHGCGGKRRMEWEEAQADLFEVQMKALRLAQTQEVGGMFINEVKNILITVIAAGAVIDGGLTLGAMLAIQSIVGQLGAPVGQLMSFAMSLQDVMISLERINEVYREREEERDRNHATAFPPGGEGGISLRAVCFRYDPHSPEDTLSDITVDIPEGKVTAVVGASGSGKTTLLKLLLGYYPVGSGVILIAGRPAEEYSLPWWRSRCGAVMQEGVVFADTIAGNIAVADGEIDMERVREAARLACIDDWVQGLPLKYDTRIGADGAGLSQGQKQRILIARAVYRAPDYIFLDEATNSLDAANEREITATLARFYCGRTVLVVAHRLSTVRDADNIIVLDRGRVVEQGTHAQLIALRGKYWSLVKNQMELGA